MKFPALAAAAVTIVLNGCASYKAVESPSLAYDVTSLPATLQQGPLTLMVHPIHQKDEVEAQFGTDLLAYQILPIQVRVANAAQAEPVAVKREAWNLLMPAGERAMLLDTEQVMDKAGKSYWRAAGWGVAFGIFGAIPSAINVSNTNDKMRMDYERRKFEDKNLLAGDKAEGILFFKVSTGLDTLDGWKLTLVTDTTDGIHDTLDYPLAGAVVVRTQGEQEKTDDQGPDEG